VQPLAQVPVSHRCQEYVKSTWRVDTVEPSIGMVVEVKKL
jgi:hypothetical protein